MKSFMRPRVKPDCRRARLKFSRFTPKDELGEKNTFLGQATRNRFGKPVRLVGTYSLPGNFWWRWFDPGKHHPGRLRIYYSRSSFCQVGAGIQQAEVPGTDAVSASRKQ